MAKGALGKETSPKKTNHSCVELLHTLTSFMYDPNVSITYRSVCVGVCVGERKSHNPQINNSLGFHKIYFIVSFAKASGSGTNKTS